MTSGQELPFYSPFKKHEYVLMNKLEPYSKKIEALIEIWKSLGECNPKKPGMGYIVNIIDWAKLHTLSIVLSIKWKSYKDTYEAKLLNEVAKTETELRKLSDVFSKKFQKLADVIVNPWEDPVLRNILNHKDVEISPAEIEFFSDETAYIVSARLKKLCESQCEDMALNLVSAFMKCYDLSQQQNFSLTATKTQILFCFDIHIALLFRYNRMSDILLLFKKIGLDEGLLLIKRFSTKRVKISKVWRNYPAITFLAGQVFVTAAVTKPVDDSGAALKDILSVWIDFSVDHSMIEKMEASVKKIIQEAATGAEHIYICCEIVYQKFGLRLKPFLIELYIRALTTDMNLLESQKTENLLAKVKETTKRLASAFHNVSKILNENIEVSKECILTAFSLEPTLERLHFIEDLARQSGISVLDTGQIWRCSAHPPVNFQHDICTKCTKCNGWMSKPTLDLHLSTNYTLHEALNFEALGISKQLCDDLAVVLNGPRYHLLSWLLQWEDLHRLCEMYLNDMKRTKNLVTDLKFVDIDYSMFEGIKQEPVDESSGVERGYERFLYADEKLVTMIEKAEPKVAENQPASDPSTLKALRMFRHNVNRNKPPNSPPVESTPDSSEKFRRYCREEFRRQRALKRFIRKIQKPYSSDEEDDFMEPKDERLSPPRLFHPNLIDLTSPTSTSADSSPPMRLLGIIDLTTDKSENPTCRNAPYDYSFRYSREFDDPGLSQFNSPHTDSSLIESDISLKSLNSTSNTLTPLNLSSTPDVLEDPVVNLPTTEVQTSPIVEIDSDSSESIKVETIDNSRIIEEVQSSFEDEIIIDQAEPVIVSNGEIILCKDEVESDFDARKNVMEWTPSKVNQNDEIFDSHFMWPTPPKNQSLQNMLGSAMKRTPQNKLYSSSEKKMKWESPDSIAMEFAPIDESELIERERFAIDVCESESPHTISMDMCSSTPIIDYRDKDDVLFQNENSSKNANRCLPIAKPPHPIKCYPSKKVNAQKTKMEADNKHKLPKELRIVLHRLPIEVMRRFIPNAKDKNNKQGRRRLNSPHVFVRIDFNKNNVKVSEDKKRTIPRAAKRDGSDIPKKTAKKPRKAPKRRNKSASIPNQKRDNSEKQIKPKKYFSDKGTNQISLAAMNPRVVLERLPSDYNYVRSVLSNVPGLNDFEMIRPSNTNHIVNVVQVSGQRPPPNTQTSTQISPHIQRIGQPRSEKPEDTPVTSAVTASTSTSIKPSTSQPSTLINILSQQIIRPGQSNCVRNRTSPLINILSQQIIRPANTQQISRTTNSTPSSEVQVLPPKVVVSQEQSQLDSALKAVATTAKTPPTAPPGQSAILQFICKSGLPKFQQAFGKTVYQAAETTDATSTSADPVADAKKAPPKSTAVSLQNLQGSVIYTRQMPVAQALNLLPPGRQVFRIATANTEQLSIVKETVIHSKMSALLAAALHGKQKEPPDEGAAEGSKPALPNARLVKPVLQIPSNVIRTSPQSNLSSTTLEQLREFDMVYKQIKERSSTSTPSEPTSDSNEPAQRISVTYLNQQGQKYAQLSPVVVVSSYCNLQPAASPALSVTSQGSSSPCVTPAPTPSAPKISSKGSKGKTVKNNTTTQASKSSPIPKPQQKPQEDEHTTQRIFDILAEYAEQLRNSPDLNNKPAPRRRSNPPTNPSQNSKRKKSSGSKKSGQCSSSLVSDADMEDHRTIGSEDSSCGVVQISVQEDEQPTQTLTTESNDSTNSRQLILTDSGNQTRNLIIADSSVGEALKMPNTAVLVPGNYIMPVSMVKGGQQIAVVSGGSKILATVPARSGPNMLLFQSFLNQNRTKTAVPTVKYSTIQPISGISSQSLAGVSGQPPVILPPNNLTAVTLGQPITLKKIDESDRGNTELLLTISQSRDQSNEATHPDSTNVITSTVSNVELDEGVTRTDVKNEKVFHTYQKAATAPIATPVIAQTSCAKEGAEVSPTTNSMTLNITQENNKSGQQAPRTLGRVQSVLVTACTSNGPMLSHPTPRFRKATETTTNNEPSTKEEFLHNGGKQNNNDQKQYQGSTYFQNKKKANPPREIQQLCFQRKQAALERELRLQKSLSEECEDLGVDEPSTSDLFPEADILFDSNHSPSFDQSSQDLVKRALLHDKEENKSALALFSDDDSSSLRADFLFESEYHASGAELGYTNPTTNGQSSASGSSCDEHALNCDLNSPEPYHENSHSLNKYKFKYSNRRKGERVKSQEWSGEVSSSEDTTGSELVKSSSHSPESCTNKRSHSVSCDDELSDGSYKVVRVAISKSDLLKDDESCEELHCEDDLDCSPSGRGARRSVKKMCSCCNGQDGGASRKRPASRPHTPVSHKKAFLTKKR